MPISKIGSKALVDCSVAAVDIADNSITAAKLAGSIANAKLANSSVTINSTSISLGASANINALDWQSVITADGSTGTTGVAGRGYFINTTSAAHTFTLPVSATRGDTIAIKDYAGTFATFNLTIARNGHKIQGVENNSLISTNRASVVLVYVDVTRGWEFVTESNVADLQDITFISATGGTITTSGNFKIHTFTGDGSFVVATLGNPAAGPAGSNVDYLVVAGGGGGGNSHGGGGGAGGFREARVLPAPESYTASPLVAPAGLSVSVQTYPITVGGGGAGSAPCNGQKGSSGNNSVFSTITSAGGGGGATGDTGSPNLNGISGGSGSGSSSSGASIGTVGSGNTPPVSPSQGNNGGFGGTDNTTYRNGGGGGGATAVGTAAGPGSLSPVDSAGPGGAGATTSISGTSTSYAGGGGGGGSNQQSTGGLGGGSAGAVNGNNASPANSNTGGGGGGGNGNNQARGSGGSGIVVIRYKFQ